MDDGKRTAAALRRTLPTDEHHRVTRFELFFDLVYVFAATQVTAYMAHEHGTHGVIQGLIVLALLWWIWSGYAWLGNQAQADRGILRGGMIVAMAAIFVVALTIPEAWSDAPDGLSGPWVFVTAYLFVRVIHLALYALAASGDAALRRQVASALGPLVVHAGFMITGVVLGGWLQTLMFGLALLMDWVGVYLTSRRGNWRIHSAGHLAERHDLFIILCIGESIVAIGVGASEQPISTPLLTAGVLGVALAVALWWLYFDAFAAAAERRFHRAEGLARVRIGNVAYTYGHYPIIAGIILAALGMEGAIAHAVDGEPLGIFYAAALYGGLSAYLLGGVLFQALSGGRIPIARAVAALVLLAMLPLGAALPALAAVTISVVGLAAVIVFESVRTDRTSAGLQVEA